MRYLTVWTRSPDRDYICNLYINYFYSHGNSFPNVSLLIFIVLHFRNICSGMFSDLEFNLGMWSDRIAKYFFLSVRQSDSCCDHVTDKHVD